MASISSAEPATKINLLSVASDAESRDLAVRGILIIAIVFGHDRMLFQSVPFYFAALYFWHVQAFFFLAYRRRSDLADVRIVDRFARYLMPFFVFAGGLALARLVFQPATTDHLLTFVLALVIGSAPLLDEATGMALFWFLPAFAGFSAATILLARMQRRWPGLAPLAIAIPALWFAATLFVPAQILRYLPLGIGLVGYLLFLAIVHRACLAALESSSPAWLKALLWAVILAALIGEAVAISEGNNVNISVFVFSKPDSLPLDLLNAAATVAAGLVVFRVASLLTRLPPLLFIGARSLDIFLIHQFFLYPLTFAVDAKFPDLSFSETVLIGVGIALVALALALLASLALDRMPALRRLIFPKDLAALRRSFILRSERRAPISPFKRDEA